MRREQGENLMFEDIEKRLQKLRGEEVSKRDKVSETEIRKEKKEMERKTIFAKRAEQESDV